MIPFLDLKAINARDREALIQAFTTVLDSGWYVLGKEVEAFEREYAAFCGTRHCIGVGNGLEALTLTLRAWLELGMCKPGDEVLVPANTYIATILAITANGLTPVLVEPEAATCNLDPRLLERQLTARTRAILPVHLYGQTADMSGVNAVAIVLVEKSQDSRSMAASPSGESVRGFAGSGVGSVSVTGAGFLRLLRSSARRRCFCLRRFSSFSSSFTIVPASAVVSVVIGLINLPVRS